MALLTHNDEKNVTIVDELTTDEIELLVKAHEEREKKDASAELD